VQDMHFTPISRYASGQSRIAYVVYRIAQCASRTTELVNRIS